MSQDSLNKTDENGSTTVAEGGKPPPATSRRRHFSMAVVNFWLDATLLVILSVYGWVSVMLRVVFPRHFGRGLDVMALEIDQWSDFQFNILCVFAVAVLVHVMLHWNWVCSVVTSQVLRTRRRVDDSMQTIYGVMTLIILLHILAAGLIAALWSVHRPPG